MGTEQEWPRMLHVREPGGEPGHSEPGKVSKAGHWEYQDYWPEAHVREELETAWLRGWNTGLANKLPVVDESTVRQTAADYAERVVGGSTRPERPEVEG